MSTNGLPRADRDIIGLSLDVAVHLAVVAIVLVSCFKIFSPFLGPVVWGIVIAVALHPVYEKMRSMIGGSKKLAGTAFILIGVGAIVVPSILLTESLIDGTVRFGRELEDGTFRIEPPSDKVKEWPVIGESLYESWKLASVNLEETAEKFVPQLKALGSRLVAAFAGLAAGVIQVIFSTIIAGIFLMNSEGGGRVAESIFARIGGDRGRGLVATSRDTIRSVVKGVILVAIIQSLLSAIGMMLVGVPAAGFWAVLVLVLAVIQLPPLLVLGPVCVYVFSSDVSTTASVLFLIWSLIISGSDSFLKPMFLGRGVETPMLVILIGAIGGVITSGILGLFIGPVVLAIGYEVFQDWIKETEKEEGITA